MDRFVLRCRTLCAIENPLGPLPLSHFGIGDCRICNSQMAVRQPIQDAVSPAGTWRASSDIQMVRLVTHSANASLKSRLVGIRLTSLALRLRDNWRVAFGDDDTAVIGLAIVAIVSERLLRGDLDPSLQNLAVPLPAQAHACCNISSIATATGFNRETTRRKVDRLVRAGMVVREGSEIRLAPGFTQQDAIIDLVGMQLNELRKTADALLKDGVFTVED